MEIDWSSGNGLDANQEIDAAIDEIAAMANKQNNNEWFAEAEAIAKGALRTALYNPKLLRDVLALLTPNVPGNRLADTGDSKND